VTVHEIKKPVYEDKIQCDCGFCVYHNYPSGVAVCIHCGDATTPFMKAFMKLVDDAFEEDGKPPDD